jgi:hypothetical protein
MFLQRPFYHYNTKPHSIVAQTVRSLSHYDDLDDDVPYYSESEIAELIKENQDLIDGFHIEEPIVHEIDEEIYKLYYDILNNKM